MTLKIWLNAFIPGSVADYTRIVTNGRHSGKSAVPLPGLARLNPLNTFKDWDAGYLTDQRDFSNRIDASVRMQSMAELMPRPRVSVIRTQHRTSGTTEVDMDTGRELASARADMSRCRFLPLAVLTPPHSTPRPAPAAPHAGTQRAATPMYELKLVGSAGDPLVSAAADIDYVGTFTIGFPSGSSGCSVTFSGKIDAFPAFEAYAQLDGHTKRLFIAPPPPGNTVLNLLGGANRRVSGSATFP